MRILFAALCLLGASLAHAAGANLAERVTSQDGHIALELTLKTDAAGKHALYYNVRYDGEPVIRESLLELRLDNHLSENAMALPVDHHARWFENLRVTGVRRASHDSTWTPVTGERARIRDHYEALTVDLVKDDNPMYKLSVEVRAYDEGVALRFAFPENEKGTYYRVIGEDGSLTGYGGGLWRKKWLLDLESNQLSF